MATKPELGITNPYALDDDAVQGRRRPAQGSSARTSRPTGAPPRQRDRRVHQRRHGRRHDLAVPGRTSSERAPTVPVKAVKPKEGTTGWSDTWMISSKAKHPNCMYKWMDYIISPEANATATVWFGEAPVSQAPAPRPRSSAPGHCDMFHATDEEYFKNV